ncbi:MAG: SpoIIE family protein phosphatase [Acidobacteriota bacterium]|nr:SpoIIE family protein phosphatase [Blastocatellia bacterium]MDW8412793.1 SpoIIE family protein phosphatase [Acidobacteriota bacterium]
MYYLIVRSPGLQPRRIFLSGQKQVIGRSSRADIHITDSFASRLHAVLELRGNDFWLTDLGSQNGTYLNEVRVTGQVCMQSGDCIRIGETRLIYHKEAADSGVAGKASIVFRSESPAVQGIQQVTLGLEAAAYMSRVFFAGQGLDKKQQSQIAEDFIKHARQRDLLALVSKVGLMLSDWSLEQLLENVLELVFEYINADRGFLLLLDNKGNLVCRAARCRESGQEVSQVSISRRVSDLVMQKKSVLTADALQDERFAGAQSILISGIRSCMAVPLALREEVIGMIYVDNPYEQRFSEADLQVLTTIASVAAIKVEQAKLLLEHMEKQRIEQELEVAASIQKQILPQEPPEIENLEVVGINIPCHTVGGDYYDFVLKDYDQAGFVIADVSGKGIPAALLVSTLQATFRALVDQHELADVVTKLNKVICRSTTPYSYITFFYGLLDRTSGKFCSVNAGHNAPLVIKPTGEVLRLSKGGFCLGMFEKATYQVEETTLGEGDIVCLFTDGVTEAANVAGEEFGEERLIKVIYENRTLPLKEISQALLRSIEDFIGNAPQHDDLTYVLFRYTPESDGSTIIFDVFEAN